MKISVVTVSFNSVNVIADNIASVLQQRFDDYEHLIIDGASDDDTLSVVRGLSKSKQRVISEPDEGIYDAMNKGVALATGEIICFLNSDDRFSDSMVLDNIMTSFNENKCDFIWGCISLCDDKWRERRFWRTPVINIRQPIFFEQLPHPAVFIKKDALLRLCRPFDCRYRLAADLDQQIKLIYKLKMNGVFIDKCLVQMRLGGASTNGIRSLMKGFDESSKIYSSNFGFGGSIFALLKIIKKFSQARFIV
jgi:glycosyltransferase involved in cell wall biosynthesis